MKNPKQTRKKLLISAAAVLVIVGTIVLVNKGDELSCEERFPPERYQTYELDEVGQDLMSATFDFDLMYKVSPNNPYSEEELEECKLVSYGYLDTLYFDGSHWANSAVTGGDVATVYWGDGPNNITGYVNVTVDSFGIVLPPMTSGHGIEVIEGLHVAVIFDGEYGGQIESCSGGGVMVVVIDILAPPPGGADTTDVDPNIQENLIVVQGDGGANSEGQSAP